MIDTSVLTVDLGIVAARFAAISQSLALGATSGAAVKANAYGLGVNHVVPVLFEAGCRDFFVASVNEGIEVAGLLIEQRMSAAVYVLSGPMPGQIEAMIEHDLIPVINSVDQAERWSARSSAVAALHIDTGMRRLGVPMSEIERAAELLRDVDVVLTMSHLACSDDAGHPLNSQQLRRFSEAVTAVGRGRISLANSGGIALGPDYHFDLVRPGIALYDEAVSLHTPIIQVQEVTAGETVGYGATHRFDGPRTIATLATGYADGFHRSGSGHGVAHIEGNPAPILGRISMDLISVDVSSVPEELHRPGQPVELIGPNRSADVVADDWGTISYEVLTALGRRCDIRYREM